MKTIYNVYEGLLNGMEDILDGGDAIADDMHKLHYNFAYLSNLPWHNKSNIAGGMRGLYRKYFIKKVPTLKTDRHSTLQKLFDHPDRIHTYNRLDTGGDYLAAYLLQVELDDLVQDYDFFNNKNDIQFLEKKLNDHLAKILNDEGKNNLRLYVERRFHGENPRILTVTLKSNDKTDFKPNNYGHGCPDMTIIPLNFTEGQYYYR